MSVQTPIKPASDPPPPLVPREIRLRIDPLLLLAALDGHGDNDRPAAVRDVGHVPGLVRVQAALGGARLAVDGIREAPEDVV